MFPGKKQPPKWLGEVKLTAFNQLYKREDIMRKLEKYVTATLAVIICLTFIIIDPVYAGVKGQCATCHTMHNSQGGVGLEDGPHPSLTNGTCIGCHTGDNTDASTTPYVLSTTTAPLSTSLAGGNFYWVLEDDRMGHNVSGIPTMTSDNSLAVAPGDDGTGTFGCSSGCHATLFNPKTSDGKTLPTGCEGCHIEPKHHAPQQVTGTPALEANGFYRFLPGHHPGSGVHGIEDSDWEYEADMTHHNEYLGDTTSTNHTMTGYCIGCHGKFHEQQDNAGNWIRHPSDAVIPSDGEYANYGFYDPTVPVARPNLETIENTSLLGEGDMVMCLSCHRAHGSPYPDALRWDYEQMKAGEGGAWAGTGCFKCHSDKD